MKDQKKSGTGNPISRLEGTLKVMGKAKYSSEFAIDNLAFAQGIQSTVAAGKILNIDTAEAEKQDGVIKIITHQNAMKLKGYGGRFESPDTKSISPSLQTTDVHYYGEYIGVVVAETFEQARYAANLVKVTYDKENPKIDFDKHTDELYMPKKINGESHTNTQWGDVDKGMNEAFKTVDVTYNTPIEHHHPMELHNIIATWEGDKVTAYASTQIVAHAVKTIADTFQISEDNVRVITPYVGGGFGSKLQLREHGILGIMAAKMTGRPVQLTVTRHEMFTAVGFRQHNRQHMRLGADKEGVLTAVAHETTAATSVYEEFQEQCGAMTRMLYNTPNSLVTHKLMKLNLPSPRWMRAPGEAPGSFALESAMDELAFKLQMDPAELRIKNDTQHDLSVDKPFSSRQLVECIRIGAKKFDWKNKWNPKPGHTTKENWLVGYGMSASSRQAPYMESSAKISLKLEGEKVFATVQSDATDIGTGSYTIIGQTVAEYLKIPIEQISVELGDSKFPKTPGSGGSWGAASYTNGAKVACDNAFTSLKTLASTSDDLSIAELMKKAKLKEFEAEGTAGPTAEFDKYSVYSFGANFCEVWVDEYSGMIRLEHFVNVGSAGKILNPKTAYGQIIGGITWGIGQALTEHSQIEPNHGNFITRSFADYHVPVNLDLGKIDVIFLPEEDFIANPMGVKGIGELGITSIAAAISNAVFNATGKRVRDLPITPEKIITTPVEVA
ncbi:xanthine dehydrogenase family protein molybdopterin-binding subunit [Leeuwenhoekiella sp. NPDC079379]|uniref:xanthine dehydrogenase family protein molybdopterin-binding subunit n=1 Tax=Leeuwenhoekiella sp. NPDC079379 TaxID=3364122 RepID=UPI0037CACEEB